MYDRIALDFVAAINSHNVEKIAALMANDHTFIDAYGNSTSREAMIKGWSGYFTWFPDYLIEIENIFVSGGMVALLGYASGTYKGIMKPDNSNHWRIPAAWKVIVEVEKVKVWQVFADSKIPFDIMNSSDR